jgi:hypothetical protein
MYWTVDLTGQFIRQGVQRSIRPRDWSTACELANRLTSSPRALCSPRIPAWRWQVRPQRMGRAKTGRNCRRLRGFFRRVFGDGSSLSQLDRPAFPRRHGRVLDRARGHPRTPRQQRPKLAGPAGEVEGRPPARAILRGQSRATARGRLALGNLNHAKKSISHSSYSPSSARVPRR